MDQGPPKALIVEDSPAQALDMKLFLEQQGMEVVVAGDGASGIRMAHECSPQIILLDIEMPGMDGFEVCRRLKEDARTTDIPIVILSVVNKRQAVLDGIDLGAVDFIPKDSFWGSVLLGTLYELNILQKPETEEESE
jgi:DNA-binding response OmpR family regulator